MKRLLSLLCVAVFCISQTSNSNANILSNKVETQPILSKSIELYLIDLSKSVKKETVIDGLKSIRTKIADVYGFMGESYRSPALSYYYWVPIRGVNDQKRFEPLFTAQIDGAIWASIRDQVGGRANQVKVLEKVRAQGGLWSRLITSQSLNDCQTKVMGQLAAPGLFGKSLSKVSLDLCNFATQSRNNYANLSNGVNSYLSGKSVNRGGSDIFGVISQVDDEVNRTSGLSNYSTIKIILVSDGIHNTPSFDLRKSLLSNPLNACSIGKSYAKGIRYSESKIKIKMYGLGEGRSQSDTNAEALRVPLREFWECFWKQKGIANPEFGQLKDLGMG